MALVVCTITKPMSESRLSAANCSTGQLTHRVLAVEVAEGLCVHLIGLEDLIADRVGQYQMNEWTMRDRLAQAIYLFNLLEEEVDLAYLDRQLAAQTLGLDVAWLRNKADEARQTE